MLLSYHFATSGRNMCAWVCLGLFSTSSKQQTVINVQSEEYTAGNKLATLYGVNACFISHFGFVFALDPKEWNSWHTKHIHHKITWLKVVWLWRNENVKRLHGKGSLCEDSRVQFRTSINEHSTSEFKTNLECVRCGHDAGLNKRLHVQRASVVCSAFIYTIRI